MTVAKMSATATRSVARAHWPQAVTSALVPSAYRARMWPRVCSYRRGAAVSVVIVTSVRSDATISRSRSQLGGFVASNSPC